METYSKKNATTVYHKKPLAPDGKRSVLVFIPGNPGLIDFYITYLDLIQKRRPNMEILAISQAGFQTTDNWQEVGNLPFFNLEYQIQHKYEILDEFIGDNDVTLTFLCHSVGCYMTQRVVKKLLDHKHNVDIDFIGLICPTIADISHSASGQKFTKLFTYLPAVQVVLYFVLFLRFILPDWAIQKVIEHVVIAKPKLSTKEALESWHNSRVAAYKIFMSNMIIRQALTLAEEELVEIHSHGEINSWFYESLSVQHQIRIWTFFAAKDHWVHDNTRDYLLSRYHDSKNKYLSFEVGDIDSEGTAITHSFCVDQSVEFAELTCKALD